MFIVQQVHVFLPDVVRAAPVLLDGGIVPKGTITLKQCSSVHVVHSGRCGLLLALCLLLRAHILCVRGNRRSRSVRKLHGIGRC